MREVIKNLEASRIREVANAGLGRYTHGLHPAHPAQHWAERTVVTSGGVNGLMLAFQALVNAGDDVVVVSPSGPTWWRSPPSWAQVRCLALVPDAWSGQWRLDLDELLAAVTPDTRMLVLNAPNNPTG